jgi:uncharacterized damage-inducible protein DinB
MSAPPVLTAQELMAWTETTSDRWRQLLTGHPELLSLPCDIAGVKTVAELLQHIVAVELRYAQRLASMPISDYGKIPFDSLDSIYAVHDDAMAILQQLLASDIDWYASIEYDTRTMGRHRSSRKTILFHALLHGIRHYAQLATLARQHGVKPDWAMDYVFMDIASV